jgi:WD40 repeat protein
MNECPSAETLGQLLAGALAEREAGAVREHLAGCPACQARMDGLSDVPELRSWGGVPRPPAGPSADEAAPPGLLERLRETALLGAATPAPAEGPRAAPLPFLGPPEKDGELGTLGPYEVLSELGRGGMGIVFKARDRELGRTVALKVLRAEGADPTARARLVREAQAAAAIEHENVVAVYAAGNRNEGPLYLVMQYVAGQTLRERIQAEGRLEPREAARVCRQAAEGLHAAHRAGLIHRDVKPANILLDADGRAKIVDFGLVRIKERPDGTTREGVAAGTPEYMSPEQVLQPDRLDERADVYGLGMTLYEALTGEPAFRGTSAAVIQQVLHDEPAPPRRLNPRVPRDLETVCLKALAREPARRYQTARELGDDLHRFLDGEPVRARPVGRRERLWRWCRCNPGLAASSGLAAAAVPAVVALSLAFAFQQQKAAGRIAREQDRTREALQEVEKQVGLAERRAALLALQTGLALCERGEVRPGMLWLAQCLEVATKPAPAGAEDLAWRARANLAHWSRELVPVRAVLPHPGGVRCVAFCPDGRTVLTGGWDGTVWRWEAATGKPVGSPIRHGEEGTRVALSGDGRRFVSAGSDQTARLWDAATGRPLSPPLAHPAVVCAVAWSPDGRTVVTGCQDGVARFWDAASGKPVGSPLPHPGAVLAVAFRPDGRAVLTGDDQGSARFWEVATGQLLGPPLSHAAFITSVAFSPDGRTALTGSDDRTARLWDARTGKPLGPPLLAHRQGVQAVAFSPDGRTVVTGSGDRTARLWDAVTGRPVGPPLHHTNGVPAVAFSPDGRYVLTGGWADPARVWDVAAGRPSLPPREHPGHVRAVAFSPNGRTIFTGCQDGVGRFWDAATGGRRAPTVRHDGRILTACFSRDGQVVLTGSADQTARLWEAATGKPIGLPLGHLAQVNGVAFSPDGRTVLTGCQDRRARFWEAATGKPLGLAALEHPRSVEAACYSPDGRTVVTCDDHGRAYFWEAATGRPLGDPLALPHGGFSLAFSPDGRTLLVGCRDMTARLWDAANRRPLGPVLRHHASVAAVAFSPDGRLILTGSYDGTARLWEATSGTPVGPPLQHDAEVAAVAFSPDGRTALTGGADRLARFWPVPAPFPEEVERVTLWVQVLTGMRLDGEGVPHMLDAEAWQACRRRLEEIGGPPA